MRPQPKITQAQPSPMQSAPDAERPKRQSAELRDVAFSVSKHGTKVHLQHAQGELLLRLDWRAAAAFLDFADRKLDAADALRLGFRPRPRESVQWSGTLTADDLQGFSVEPRFVGYDLARNQFRVNLADPWRDGHWLWLFVSEATLRALTCELRNGLALRRQVRRD